MTLPNGMRITIPAQMREEVVAPPAPDKVKAYGHLVLELGTQFHYLLELMKAPSRERLLPIFKMLLTTMKANNTQAKYPLEILRLLIQQYSLFPLDEACQLLNQCFVNTHGKPNSFVPCDQVMEWNVRDCKRHVKHMFSNKNEANISVRSAALGSMEQIALNYDKSASVIDRHRGNKHTSSLEDEVRMIEDLRELRPFEHTPNRQHRNFIHVEDSIMRHFDGHRFNVWFHKHKNEMEA